MEQLCRKIRVIFWCQQYWTILAASVKWKYKYYKELVELMKNHHNLKLSVIAEKFRFNKRDRKQGERIVQYVVELRILTEYCEYETSL